MEVIKFVVREQQQFEFEDETKSVAVFCKL